MPLWVTFYGAYVLDKMCGEMMCFFITSNANVTETEAKTTALFLFILCKQALCMNLYKCFYPHILY